MIETLSWQEAALQWFERVQIDLDSTDTLTRLDAEGKQYMCTKNLSKAVETVKHLNTCFALEIDWE